MIHPEFAKGLIDGLKKEKDENSIKINELTNKNDSLSHLIRIVCKEAKLHVGGSFHTGPGDYCVNCGGEM